LRKTTSDKVLRPPPAYQCYASDWSAKEDYRLASAAERGVLWSILNQCWVSDSVPSDPTLLAKLLQLDSEDVERALRGCIKRFLKPSEDGRLYLPELRDQKEEYLARRRERSESGRKGAEALHSQRSNGRAMAKPTTRAIAAPEVRGAEQHRADAKREASLEGGNNLMSLDAEEWLKGYENTESEMASRYRNASNGG
jgi:hypothetical protein